MVWNIKAELNSVVYYSNETYAIFGISFIWLIPHDIHGVSNLFPNQMSGMKTTCFLSF